MSKKLLKRMESFINYIKRTSKNKRYALALIGLGLLSVPVAEDGTYLFVMLMIGLPLFLTKENIFE